MNIRHACRWGTVVVTGLTAGAFADDRTIDGTGNNVVNPLWGCANSNLIRGASGAHYTDGMGGMIDRGNPRAISNALSVQTAPVGNSRFLSSMAWQWGQFMDHDLALVNEGISESVPIAIPSGDPTFDPGHTGTQTMSFFRSDYTDGVNGLPRQQTNVITHWIDGSMVYGSDTARAAALRAGSGGRLATAAGNMLPFNTAGLPNGGGADPSLRLAGDVRANEQTGLTAMHTVFVREHNRLADQLAAANPTWSDDQIYQRARKLVGAEIQSITYNQWLPALLGNNGLGAYAGYNASVNPSLDTAFSTAAFRFGHTMLNDQLLRYNEDGSVYGGGHLSLFQSFFNPASLTNSADLDAVLRGLARQQSNEVDTQAIDGVRNLLFGPPGSPGRDLIATNIERGRDHGIPDYNTIREDYGLARVTSFSEITSDPAMAAALAAAYGNDINSIDAWIGLMAEDHLSGGSFGLTVTTILNDQFARLRDGDRFFYLNDPELSAEDIQMIQSLSLGEIIRLNTGVVSLQGDVFFVPGPETATLLGLAGLVAVRRRRRA